MAPTIAEALHVFCVDGYVWCIGHTSEEAIGYYLGEDAPGDDPPEAVELPDAELFCYSPDGGDTYEEKPCGQWAAERGAGWFAREL